MDVWRKELHKAYFKLESNQAHKGRLDESVFKDVHDLTLNILNTLLENLGSSGEGGLKLVHFWQKYQ
jgi:hypothetical protein